jgi:ribonuclease J
VTGDSAEVVDRVHAGLSYVDQAGGGDITESVLRDRRHLADDGLILVVARVDASTGQPFGEVEIVTRGFGSAQDEELIEETRAAVEDSLTTSAGQRVVEMGVLQHQLHDTVAGLIRKRTSQRPMVVPVILEV